MLLVYLNHDVDCCSVNSSPVFSNICSVKATPADAFELRLFPWDSYLDLSGEIRESICHSDSQATVVKTDDDAYLFAHDKWNGSHFRVTVIGNNPLSVTPSFLPSLNRELPTEDNLLPIVDLSFNGENADLDAAANGLCSHPEFSSYLEDFLRVLCQSVQRRLVGVDRDTGVGVLFSGGVDCSLIAAIVDRLLPDDVAVDLLNVAFQPIQKSNEEQVAVKNFKKKEKTTDRGGAVKKANDYDVPDRRTGLNAWRELKSINSNRLWRFVVIDVPFDELTRMKRERISKLIYPLRTILDDSIGCATWFSARGRGNLVGNEGCDLDAFESSARVLFIGSGADEQLGG